MLTGDTQLTERRPLLEQIVEAIVRVAQPEQIILFGSRARGNSQESSDYDFLLVDAKPFGNGRSRLKQVSKVLRVLATFRVSIDLLIYSTDEIDYWRDSLNHVVGRALREGSIVYERHQSS